MTVGGAISACAGSANSSTAGNADSKAVAIAECNATDNKDANAIEDAASQFFMYLRYHRPSHVAVGFTLTSR